MNKLIVLKSFEKDLKKLNLKREKLEKLFDAVARLLSEEPLPTEMRDHKLVGELADFREFHLGGDLLVLYRVTKKEVFLVRIGTHNQLFK
ncbi:hypothetical protein JCM13304A_24700 [Desulfothermus okinawensis JCM 13304]